MYVRALVDGGLLDPEYQKIRLDSIKPTVKALPRDWDTASASSSSTPASTATTGQLPGFSSFMVRDAGKGNTIIIGTNLSASPVGGEERRSRVG